MTDPKPRRSRTAWPGPLSVAGVGEGHAHDLPEALIKTVRSTRRALYVIGLCLVAVCVLLLLIIFERGAARDAENQRIRDTFCQVFDVLPEGGALDRPRQLFDCGPGIPLSELPEDIRRRYTGEPAPAPAPATTAPTPTTQPPMGAPAVPNPPRPTPNEPPAGNSPKPTPPPAAPSTPPAGVLEPVTDTVCDLINVCIEEP